MAGLQRSSVSFRRQGSSGLVWDDSSWSGELARLASQRGGKVDKIHCNNINYKKEEIRTVGLKIERSQSHGSGRGFRTAGRVVEPAVEPPSPKVSACGFCGGGGKNSKKARRRPTPSSYGKRV